MKRRDKSSDCGWLFITGATYRRVPVFATHKHCEIFVDNLRFYRRKYGFDVFGFVLLPDHYHLLLNVPPEVSLTDLLRDFKSAVGKQIVEDLKKTNQRVLLHRLKLLHPPRRHKDARFRVLQPDNFIKRIVSDKFFQQKLDYIHLNPVREGLAENPADYPYCSARWYARGEEELAQWRGPLG
jgi:REP element-mobilizing transposase RayT